jgi:hypothetical protein
MACKIFAKFPFELKKVAANSIDAAHSIWRNISEGYWRRSLKAYLNLKVLIQIQKSCGSNPYSNMPVCQHSMSVGQGLNVKNSLISNKL